MAIEPPWPQQSRIEYIRPIGRRQHDHHLAPGEAGQLREDLLAFAMAIGFRATIGEMTCEVTFGRVLSGFLAIITKLLRPSCK